MATSINKAGDGSVIVEVGDAYLTIPPEAQLAIVVIDNHTVALTEPVNQLRLTIFEKSGEYTLMQSMGIENDWVPFVFTHHAFPMSCLHTIQGWYNDCHLMLGGAK